MSKVNRGKDFENVVLKAFENLKDVSIDRLIDPMGGYKGVRNISDYIIYRKPYELYLECKTCYGNTLPFSNITQNQWIGMLNKSGIDGCIAGVMIWFIDHNRTIFIPIQVLETAQILGLKSVNIKHLDEDVWDGNYYDIQGTKKRIFFEYDMNRFLNELEDSYNEHLRKFAT